MKIANVPNFPKEGILFKDITPLMADGEAFSYACSQLAEFAKKVGAEVIAGPESRGFIFGCPVAKELGISRSYVSRLEKRALTKLLREFIKNKNS